MILSRVKPALAPVSGGEPLASKDTPSLEDFLAKRDYIGAMAILEFDQSSGRGSELVERWLGYCAFHLGDYRRAMAVYETLLHTSKAPDTAENLACCYFYLGMYPQAEKALDSVPTSQLKTRLLFHLSHKQGAEKRLMEQHQALQDIIQDQLSLAAIHYLRSHYNEAIDIYKRILLDNRPTKGLLNPTKIAARPHQDMSALTELWGCYNQIQSEDAHFISCMLTNRENLALNVYVALCYYKLDYYDVSQEVLAVYLQRYPDSAIAINLKACNHFRLYNGKAAEAEIKRLVDQSSPGFSFGHDLIRHNMVVFASGVGALQVLPPLVDVIPEARLNLVIYYLKQEEYEEAYELIKDLEPSVPQEYILKGIVNIAIGQETGSRVHLKAAQELLRLVGSSASECDTIPGRQCMASSFFLQHQFHDVNLYLSSIKSYYTGNDSFNFNYAQTKCALGQCKEAEELLLVVQNENIRNDYVYISHLARCLIMNGKGQAAWELYLKMETCTESFSLLQLIGNDCYRVGQFWHAAKAFDMLERLDPNPEHWEGKRGACAGLFQLIVAGKQPKELLSDVINLLRNTANSQVEGMIRTLKKWAKENRINI